MAVGEMLMDEEASDIFCVFVCCLNNISGVKAEQFSHFFFLEFLL